MEPQAERDSLHVDEGVEVGLTKVVTAVGRLDKLLHLVPVLPVLAVLVVLQPREELAVGPRDDAQGD